MLDTITLRQNGLPTVTLSFDTFEHQARMMAKINQVPDVPIVILKHYETNQTPEMARKEVDDLADTIFSKLVKSKE